MLKVRKTNPAFHPWGEQQVLSVDKGIFALLRTSLDGDTHTLCLHNVTAKTINLEIDLTELPFDGVGYLSDILTAQKFVVENTHLIIKIAPYQVLWLHSKCTLNSL
jgi:sucrose phosphorylase